MITGILLTFLCMGGCVTSMMIQPPRAASTPSTTQQSQKEKLTTRISQTSTTLQPTTKECIVDGTQNERQFATIESYQSNKNSFNPNDQSYLGNVVSFNATVINGLKKNDFMSFDSDYIIEIKLDRKHVSDINVGAFTGLFCLHYLDLSYNNLTVLPDGAFAGLDNLRRLKLDHNKLKISPYISNMRYLTDLDLSYNSILQVKPFTPLKRLTVLDLSHNQLRTIERDTFDDLMFLDTLFLNNNEIVTLEAEHWKGLIALNEVDVSNNRLPSFDTTFNYSFYNLRVFNISFNKLSAINTDGIAKQFIKLKVLDIRGNSWNCDTLDTIKRVLKDTKIFLVEPLDCTADSNAVYSSLSEATTHAVTSSYPSSQVKVKDYSKDIESLNSEILTLQDNAKHLKTLVVFLFMIIFVFIMVEVATRFGFCDHVRRSFRRRRGEYFDDNVEHVSLVTR